MQLDFNQSQSDYFKRSFLLRDLKLARQLDFEKNEEYCFDDDDTDEDSEFETDLKNHFSLPFSGLIFHKSLCVSSFLIGNIFILLQRL